MRWTRVTPQDFLKKSQLGQISYKAIYGWKPLVIRS